MGKEREREVTESQEAGSCQSPLNKPQRAVGAGASGKARHSEGKKVLSPGQAEALGLRRWGQPKVSGLSSAFLGQGLSQWPKTGTFLGWWWQGGGGSV